MYPEGNFAVSTTMFRTRLLKWIMSSCVGVFSLHSATAQFSDYNYAYFGLTHNMGSVQNAYHFTQLHDDKFSGPGVLFGCEGYDEDGDWTTFSADGLLLAVVSIISPTFVPQFDQYKERSSRTPVRNAYLMNTPLLKWGGAFTPGKQDRVGINLQLGLEGLSVLEIGDEGKGSKYNRAIGGQNDGFFSFGTGLQLCNPFRNVGRINNSRLTFNVDWMLAREADEKFRVNGRKRFTLELVTMIGRRGYAKAFYQFVDYRNAFYLNVINEPSPVGIHSKMSVFGVGIGFNWISSD
jgi:hypothetical protein